MVHVTHDQTEAMTFGDRVAVMRAGVIQQVDSPGHLYEKRADGRVDLDDERRQ